MAAVNEWLFAAPWWLLATAGSASVALLIFAFARVGRRPRQLAILAVLGVVSWAAASAVVETATEMAVTRTREMVAAYEQADWTRLSQLIDAETRFSSLLRGQEIVEVARLTQASIGRHPLTITQIRTRRDDVGVLVSIRIRTQPAQSALPFVTAWGFDYRKLGDAWRLERIEPDTTEFGDQNTVLRNLRLPPDLENRRR